MPAGCGQHQPQRLTQPVAWSEKWSHAELTNLSVMFDRTLRFRRTIPYKGAVAKYGKVTVRPHGLKTAYQVSCLELKAKES